MNKFPKLYIFLWKGIPSPSTTLISSCLITSPGLFLILIFLPSKWVITKSTPVKAFNSNTSFSITKSAPFLKKFLWGICLTWTITSPASASGTSSPSPWIVYYSLSGAPLSISTFIVFISCLIFFPLQALHFFVGSTLSPYPLHSSHGPDLCEYIPGPNCIITVLIPFPLQPLQVTTALASVPPTPLHFAHILCLSISNSVSFPLYKSSRVTSRIFPRALTFF